MNALAERAAAVFAKEVVPALDEHGIGFAHWAELSDDDRAYLDTLFTENIFPVLTPLAVDPAHPFPYISNLSLNLAVTVRDSATGEERFARVKVPPRLPRFLELPDAQRFVLLEQLIAAKLETLFPGMEGSRTPRSGSPATPTSSSKTRPKTSWRRSSRSCAGAAASAASCGSRSTRA